MRRTDVSHQESNVHHNQQRSPQTDQDRSFAGSSDNENEIYNDYNENEIICNKEENFPEDMEDCDADILWNGRDLLYCMENGYEEDMKEDQKSKEELEENQDFRGNRVLVDDRIIGTNQLLKKHHHIYTLEKTVNFRKLDENSEEYKTIHNFFYKTTYPNFKITQIEQINNPYLYAAYLLKKEQLERKKPGNWEELWLFHGTKERNVKDICTYNLNWRLYGECHLWGKGVSFTPLASYSRFYSDEGNEKVVLLCYVMVKDFCSGYSNMQLPDYGCDTSKRETGEVLVKYEDHEFYPAYKICYTETPFYFGGLITS